VGKEVFFGNAGKWFVRGNTAVRNAYKHPPLTVANRPDNLHTTTPHFADKQRIGVAKQNLSSVKKRGVNGTTRRTPHAV
ncbi:MAG: hypothetical protein KDD89_17060, partial [Anaerolineales bacterium]|nr:hypothetical protein [Anaerolineales bacterium]